MTYEIIKTQHHVIQPTSHHFDLFAFNIALPDLFKTECQCLGQNYRALRNGEGIDLWTTLGATGTRPMLSV